MNSLGWEGPSARRADAMVRLALDLGLRRGEIAGSHWRISTGAPVPSGYAAPKAGAKTRCRCRRRRGAPSPITSASNTRKRPAGQCSYVANFVSGLIILFERPIRVGDAVTVGDTDGIVTKIKIRTTTIRNWDGKELLVPNKEFITGRLLNWSLSDPTTRLVLSVGIAIAFPQRDVHLDTQGPLRVRIENADGRV